MTRFRSSRERGAVLIHVAVAMLGLLAFSALVVDYGVFWVARRQAQNAADAGALAGAMGLAYDSPTDKTDTGPAKQAAYAAALANVVFGGVVSVNITTDITFPVCPDDGADTCVKVDVYRTAGRGNALPTFFSRLVGINSQDVRATATAKVLSGNATTCMRPFAILDKWDEYDDTTYGPEYEHEKEAGSDRDWDPLTSTFDKYDAKGEDPGKDLYEPHGGCDPGGGGEGCTVGTGFRLFDEEGKVVDYGSEIKIKTGAQDQTSAGWFMPVRLAPGDSGAKDYCENIKGCSGVTNIIGETISTENGNMVGPTSQCLWTDKDSLYSQDPTARWEPDALNGKGAVVSDDYPINQSPRIVPLPVINPDEFFKTDPNGHTELTVRNILGFFIERSENTGGHTQTVGRLVTVPGFYAGGNVVDPTASFIKQIILIR